MLAATATAAVRSTHAGGTLVFAGAADPTLLDPGLVSDGESFRATEQMFETLVKLKPGTLKLVPDLATKWTPSNAGKTWTFTLRPGVKFTRRHAVQRQGGLRELQPLVQLDGPVPGRRRDLLLPGSVRRLQEQRELGALRAAVQELRRQGQLDGRRQPDADATGTFIDCARAAGVRDAEPDGDEEVRRRTRARSRAASSSATGTYGVQPPDRAPARTSSCRGHRPEARARRGTRTTGARRRSSTRLIIRPISANTARAAGAADR